MCVVLVGVNVGDLVGNHSEVIRVAVSCLLSVQLGKQLSEQVTLQKGVVKEKALSFRGKVERCAHVEVHVRLFGVQQVNEFAFLARHLLNCVVAAD